MRSRHLPRVFFCFRRGIGVFSLLGFVLIFALLVDGQVSGDEEDELNPPALAKQPKPRDAFARSLPVPIRIPGEYGRLSAVLLSANELVHFHRELFAELVGRIGERVPVIAVVAGPEQVLNGREALEEAGVPRERVHFLMHTLDSLWMRDYGPVFIRRSDGSGAIVDPFYAARDEVGDRRLDDRFPLLLANALELPCSYVPVSLEGGNLVHNGYGIGISSYKLVDRNRFRNFGNEEFPIVVSSYFSLKSLSLVPSLPGESTGHVDMFMTFTGPRSVVVAEGLPGEDPAVVAVLDRAIEQLSELDVDGAPLNIHRIPLPSRKGDLWRSYTNVFYVNGLLLVPSYSDVPAEVQERVFQTYRSVMPQWEIVPVNADGLIATGGFLHCMTLGIPHFVDPSPLLEMSED